MSYTEDYITVFQTVSGISVITCTMFVTEIHRNAQTFRETTKATMPVFQSQDETQKQNS